MGYYSTLTINTFIKKENIKDVKGILAGIEIKMSADIAEPWEYEFSEFKVDEYGSLGVKDGSWNAKWYNDKDWVYVLAPFLEDGDIELRGEEGEKWGYRIIDGIAYELNFNWVVSLGESIKKTKNKGEN